MPKMPSSPPLNRRVAAIAYDGLCTFEFGVAVEVFGLPRPEMGPDWYEFTVCAADAGELRGLGGVRILPEGDLSLLETAGTIIVPGWRGIDTPVPDSLSTALRNAYAAGARILSICSGVFVLAAAGLLDGKRATTHWRYAETLSARFPSIRVEPHVLYIDEGTVLTSAGSAAGIDLCLHVVRRDFGTEAANKVARRLVVPPHRDGGQAQFVERPVPVPNESSRLAPLLDRMRQDVRSDYTIEAMARAVGMSPRTFLRRFQVATGTTPGKWLLAERLAKARNLLEATTEPIHQIAEASGFGSADTLRHHFRHQLGTTPAAYRNRFSRGELEP